MEKNVKHVQIEFKYANELFERKKYTECIESCRKIEEIEKGRVNLLMGKAFEEMEDFKHAMKCFEVAGKEGLIEGKYREGLLLEKQDNVLVAAARMKEVADWKSSVDDTEFICKAKFNLGRYFDDGIGLVVDKERAIKYYMDSDMGDGYFAIGLIFDEQKNVEEAIKYYELALEKGNKRAAYNLAQIMDELDDADKAFSYYEKASAMGSKDSIYQLAVCYDKGEGVEANPEKAIELYEKAAELGHLDAMYNLALCIEKERPKDALQFYITAALEGHPEAEYNLGHIFDQGELGEKQNKQKAFVYYERAAKHGHKDALFNLACMFRDGDGVDEDKQAALEYFKLAHKMGHDRALVNIGLLIYTDEQIDQIRQGKKVT